MNCRRTVPAAFVLTVVLASCSSVSSPRPSSSAFETQPTNHPPSRTPIATEVPLASASTAVSDQPVSALGWQEVALFGQSDAVEEATSVTFGAGQFVAVGSRYEFAPGNPGSYEARVWRSLDGRSWEATPTSPTFERATLTTIITAGDGSLVVYGYVSPPPSPMHDEIPTYHTWRSTDGLTWRRSHIESLARGVLPVNGVVHGRQGYLVVQAHQLDLGAGPSGSELWHSLDGLSWELAHENAEERIITIGAGDEGFVAVRSAQDSASRVASASADGREWFDGDALSEDLVRTSPGLAALGGEWVMVGLGSDGPPTEPGPVSPGAYDLPVWFSANGLAWQHVATIGWQGDGLGFASHGPLVSVGDRLFLSPAAAGAGPRLSSAGVWSSADGTSWTSTDIPAGVTIVDGAEHAGTVVLVGYVGAGESAGFWSNERP